MAIDKTIAELIDRAELSAETVADLRTYLTEFEAGELHPDDAAYVQALHARLLGGRPPKAGGGGKTKAKAKPGAARPPGTKPAAAADTSDPDEDDFEAEVEDIAEDIDWRARAEAAEAELAALRAAPAPPTAAAAPADLTEVRARLAEALHPDKGEYAEAEAAARAAVLAEVWAVLDDIEAGAGREPPA